MIDPMIQFAVNNGVGVYFGTLMLYMANTTIRDNTKAIKALTEKL